MRSLSRRTFGAALAATTALACLGAGPALAKDKTYALIQINQQALFFNQINEGAQEAADKSGDKLVIFNANNDPSAQNSAIETYITQKVDGFIVVAIDVNGIMPAVEAANEAGIPVVAIDAVLPEGPQKAQIGVDNGQAGADMGAYFVDYVKSNMDGKAKVGIVGALNSFIQNLRQKGFEDAIKDKDGIEVAGVVDGQNIQDNALTAAENLITGNPDLTAIYATGEPALLGAIAAVESQGKQDDIKIFGWDLTAQAISGIDAGYVAAVVQQDPKGEGVAAVEALDKVTSGGTVEKSIDIPVTIVTKANVDPYRDTFK
ncbi:ABC transporter substrate-binding protein [Roseibium marinum]|uniref:Ribose transport system substrate-binding protein n=1 Tax=Roseibium marinum TaxID=281252 RepID=A0A2S3UL23_9HYPH|nr:substrate-binding domain-containing protein [Roseibium marinum]POF28253.1 ribose transport system substrate-binding protein [Roseibium marinum]